MNFQYKHIEDTRSKIAIVLWYPGIVIVKPCYEYLLSNFLIAQTYSPVVSKFLLNQL